MRRAKFSGARTIDAIMSWMLISAAFMQTLAWAQEVVAEPPLRLVHEERFDSELGAGWELPVGWGQVEEGDGYALEIAAAEAGLSSVVLPPDGVFGDVVVEGHFTFLSADATALLLARSSASGAYVARLNASGGVTLEKRDGRGLIIASWSATAEPQALAGAARRLQLSVLGDALRVTVDDVDVLTVKDETPLPAGGNQVGVEFGTVEGGMLFDDYFVWVPEQGRDSEEMTLSTTTFSTQTVNAATNDLFADREVVTGGRYLHIADNSGCVENEVAEPVPSAASDLSKTVWYEFTPTVTRPYVLTSFGSSFNTAIAVYTGTWGALTQVGFADDIPGSQQAQLSLTLNVAQTYFIQLGGRGGSGAFEFRLMDPADSQVPSTPAISAIAAGAPSTPVANKGITNSLQPVVAWAPRPTITPYAYVAELSTAANFSSILTSGTVTDPTRFWSIAPSLETPAQAAGQKYYWRVSAMNFLGQSSTYSPAYSFTLDTSPPAKPSLMAPVVNGVVATLRPTLKWGPVKDATAYRARIASNFSVSTIVGDNDQVVTPPSYTPLTDLYQGEYWFGVESQDAAGNWSGMGEKRRFAINLSLAPANGANIIVKAPSYKADVVFSWTKIPNANYTLQVATDSSFTAFQIDEVSLTSSTYTVKGMPPGNYFWRVSVNGQYLPMSLARRFNVTTALPVAPLIQTVGAVAGAVKDKGFTNDVTPVLDWTVPANWTSPLSGSSITYELQVSTNSGFTNLAVPTITGIFDSHYDGWSGSLAAGTTYYWRVRAITNLNLAGAYSKVYSFTIDQQAPTPPGLLTPALDAVISTQRPTFKWSPVKDATAYRFKLATTSDLATGIVVNVEQVATSYTPPDTLYQGEYWFNVEACDAAGNWSNTGETRSFILNLSVTPADGAVIAAKASQSTADVVFTWANAKKQSCSLQVSKESDFYPLYKATTPFTGTTHTFKEVPVGLYYWRVLINGSPVTSLNRTFIVTPALPVAPLIQTVGAVTGALADKAITSDSTPVFDWTVPTNWVSPLSGSSITYELQVSSNSSFSSLVGTPVTGISNSDFEWTQSLSENATYYWRVRAVTNLGVAGAYSKTYSFTFDTQPPAPPGLLAPVANSIASTLRPTLKWSPVKDATAYRVRIASNFSATTIVGDNDQVVTAASYTPSSDLYQGEYWFSVESRDAAGNWSGTGAKPRFVVNLSLTPANGANIIATAPQYQPNVSLTWTKITGATYRIEIAYDASFSALYREENALTQSSYTLNNVPVGTYFWRVAVNGMALPSSLARSFTVTPALPVAPLIQTIGPAPGAVTDKGTTHDTTPLFDWTVPANWTSPPVASSIRYEVQLSTNSTFSSVLNTSTGLFDSHYEWSEALTPGMYYWRVRAVTNLGLAGAYSKAYVFTVQ